MNICRTVEREREDKRIREGGRDARVRKREGGSERGQREILEKTTPINLVRTV